MKILKATIQIILFVSSIVLSQNYYYTGMVVDSVNNASLPGVNVVAVSKQNNTMLSGTRSNQDGSFALKIEKNKQYRIEFSIIGFKKKIFHNRISTQSDTINLGKIQLSPSVALLNEVVVKGQRQAIEYHIDKQVININKLPGSNGSITDALSNSGIVTVDPRTKEISIRGNKQVNIMIDGRPSPMGAQLLAQMPANYADYVEIKTNPSAKEDPEGDAGILNVVTKKNTASNKYNGSIYAAPSTQNMHYGSFMFNYKKNNINIFTGITGQQGISKLENELRQINYSEAYNNSFTSNMNDKLTTQSIGYRMAIDLDYDKENFFSVAGTYYRNRNTIDDITNSKNNNMDKKYSSLMSSTKNDDKNNYTLTAFYKRKINTNGCELTADAYYLKQENYSLTNRNTLYSYSDIPDVQKNETTDDNKTLIIKLDYVNPTAKYGTIEAGYRYTFRDRKNIYANNNYLPERDLWDDLDNLSNEFRYKENIHAVYLTHSYKYQKYEYKMGLRVEESNTKGFQYEDSDGFSEEKFSCFPSVALSYNINSFMQLAFNFSRRITRPQMYNVNPFEKKLPNNIVYKGNSKLEPTYSNRYELSLNPYIRIFHNYSTGTVTKITSVQNDTITVNTYVNANEIKNSGIELNYTYIKGSPFLFSLPEFIGMLSAGFSYYRRTEKAGYQLENYSLKDNKYSFNANVNIQLIDGINAMVSYLYTPAVKNERYQSNSKNFLNLSFDKSYFNRKLSVSVQITDILNSSEMKSETFGSNFYSYTSFSPNNSRSVSLSLLYNFNDFKSKKERQTDDGRDRIE